MSKSLSGRMLPSGITHLLISILHHVHHSISNL